VDQVTGYIGLQRNTRESYTCSNTRTYAIRAFVQAPVSIVGIEWKTYVVDEVFRLGVYANDDVTGYPTTILTFSAPVTCTISDCWFTTGFPDIFISSPRYIWLAITAEGVGSHEFGVSDDVSWPAVTGLGNLPDSFVFDGTPDTNSAIKPNILVQWLCP